MGPDTKDRKAPRPSSYKDALISYVDILGFRDLIDRSANSGNVEEIIDILEKFQRRMKKPFVHRDPYRSPGGLITKNFSDLIVRCKPLGVRAAIGDFLRDELYMLTRVQMQLAIRGIFVRGGVAAGKIYLDNVVFGPALVKAYELESQYAIYPRIVVHRDLAKRLKKTISSLPLLDRGEDGAYFIDYLRAQCSVRMTLPDKRDDILATEVIRKHRARIEAVILDEGRPIRSRSESVKKKFMWLALYHNRTVHSLLDDFKKHLEARPIEREAISEKLLHF
jgi:hypothetical protein